MGILLILRAIFHTPMQVPSQSVIGWQHAKTNLFSGLEWSQAHPNRDEIG